jgi:hypothetical protein
VGLVDERAGAHSSDEAKPLVRRDFIALTGSDVVAT